MNENPDKSLTILAFFAHPDDETMFLGGTFAFLANQGAKVHFICATRGEGGERGDPPICAWDELGRVREQELVCAVKVLGGASLRFAGYQDPEVGPDGELYPFTDNLEKIASELQEQINRLNPQVIITHGPGGEYGHPAHIQAHQAMMLALDTLDSFRPAVYAPSWLSRETGVFTPTPAFLVDITPWKEQKTKAVLCHKSQHGLFLRHGAARAGRPVTVPEIIRCQEALCQIHPAEGNNQQDHFEELLADILSPDS